MSYSTGEALILTRVQACSNFSSSNTSQADWGILNSGKSDHYAILRPGVFSIEWITPLTYVAHWTTVVELWQQYTGPGTAESSLYARAADLLAIQTYPKLGDTSGTIERNATFSGGEDPKEMWRKDGGPMWLKWELKIEWNEETTATYSE
jgi:hypothetical protein